MKEAYSGNGKIINSDFLNNLDIETAKKKIIDEIEKKKLEKEKLYLDLKTGEFLGNVIGDAPFR